MSPSQILACASGDLAGCAKGAQHVINEHNGGGTSDYSDYRPHGSQEWEPPNGGHRRVCETSTY